MSSKWLSVATVVTLSLTCNRFIVGDEQAFDTASLEFFEKEVRPLLVERCYECHSAKAKELKGGLRVDSRKLLLRGGDTGPAIVPGNTADSLLVDAINYGELYEMPPKSKMAAAEIATLTKWVAMGSPWPPEQADEVGHVDEFDLAGRKAAHWCWQPVSDPPLPPVQSQGWPTQALDHFILAKLEDAGLSPALPADKRTLIRRAYFDLIGLPPSIDEVNAFIADESPQAFEKVVDHLLESPHFGERWARHWMDLARYAETYGHEFDYPLPHAFKYRDYLIRAFNADVPYDQFVIEHVAGDLLDAPRVHPQEGYNESQIATGFWWLGEATHSPVDVRDNEAGRIDNQLDVFGKTFLGLTIGCARCHDHKFDAISTKDYYALAGFMQSSRRAELINRHGEIGEASVRLRYGKIDGSKAFVEGLLESSLTGEEFTSYLLAARAAMFGDSKGDVAAAAAAANLDASRLTAWVNALQAEDVKQRAHPLHVWHLLAESPTAEKINAVRSQVVADAERHKKLDETHPLLSDFSDVTEWITAGDAFPTYRLPVGEWDPYRGASRWASCGTADSSRLGLKFQGSTRSPTFVLNHRNIYYRAKGKGVKIRLVLDGYFMDVYNALLFRGFSFDLKEDGKFAWHHQGGDIGRYLGHRAYIEVLDHGDGYAAIDEIRFSNEGAPPELFNSLAGRVLTADTNSLEGLAGHFGEVWEATRQELADFLRQGWNSQSKLSAAWTNEQTELLDWCGQSGLIPFSKKTSKHLNAYYETWQEEIAHAPDTERVLGLTDGTGENEHVFVRGNHKTLGPEAPRQLLEALDGKPLSDTAGSGRLQLARELVEPANPLVSRVMVNRLWHHLFGRGIVASTDNFGVLGQAPSHPQLLDHLATRFVAEGWSVKKLLKTVMLSSTYQMASTPNAQASAVDPTNVLLHRARIRRLQGEAIRDAMLTISGRLDRTLYGGSVPIYITPFMQGRGRPQGNGPLDGNGRRSIYIAVRRNFLSPMMMAFDTPIPFNSVGRRNVSNVPAQALTVMNDPFVVEQASLWAKQTIKAEPDPHQRIKQMYQAAFARLPTDSELADATAFLNQQAAELGINSERHSTDERLWTDLCHVLMNVKEFVFIQ